MILIFNDAKNIVIVWNPGDVLTHAYNLSTWVEWAEAGSLPQVWDQPELNSKILLPKINK